MDKPALLATVFTDYICPFCYVGDVRLERLREHFDLKINWCFLEIHPDTPASGMPVQELGYADAQWRQMMDNLVAMAAAEGISFREHDFTTSSHRALLLAEAAKEAGAEVFYRLHRRLFMAYFTEGRNIGDAAVLRQLAAECGVAAATVERAWREERYEQQLQRYLVGAHELEVRATPTIFFGRDQRLNGALPFEAFLRAARAGAAAQQTEAEGVAIKPDEC
jgi:predicted DsbA family dithiol-disulfide isomerase